jgi:4-amino-4-deoxy-L-arabinose transferase-like glycosyltransferase
VQNPAVAAAWQQEGSQPPLYYALAALITAWIDTDDLDAVLWQNPLSNIGNPLASGNKNLIIHTGREAFPWRGTVLAIHLLRWLSLLLQSITVFAVYRLAQEIVCPVPSRTDLALLAVALVVFNPMFLFIAASVNNDNLIVPLATLALLLFIRTLKDGWLSDRRAVLLGVLLGMAALTKLSGLALLPLAAVVLFVVAARRRAWVALLRWGVILALLVVAIAGWWYVRNWLLYGDPTGLNAMLDIAGRRLAPSLRQLLGEFQGFRMSYWGVFGGFNVVAPEPLYWFYDALASAGLLGWIPLALRLRGSDRRRQVELMLLLAAWLLIVLVSLFRWTSQTYASQGRLIFPASGAVAIWLAFGLAGWLPRRWQGRAAVAVSAALGLIALALPFTTIAPAYARPPLLTAAQVPSAARRSDTIHADTLRLLAFDLPRQTVRPGDTLPVTVYWEAVRRTDQDLSVYVHLLGRRLELAGQIGTYPGLGAYPTSLLQPGHVVADTYPVPVVVSATAPSLLRVDVGLFIYGKGNEAGLPVTDRAGRPTDGLLGVVRLLPHKPVAYTPANPIRFDLGGQVVLLGYDLTPTVVRPADELVLTLYWQALTRLSEDYKVFVHLVSPAGRTVAQGDKEPLDGDWPTWAWEPGYPLRDSYPIRLPSELAAGSYTLQAGLYRLADGWRLPVQGPPGRVQNSAMILGQVDVR